MNSPLRASAAALVLLACWSVDGLSVSGGQSRSTFLKGVTSGAFFLPTVAWADGMSLLDEFGSDSTKIVQKKAGSEGPEKRMVARSEGSIDPNLRANYYYPTARKRYLPRIKKASDQISLIPDKIAAGDWEAVAGFSTKVADDAVLPMKLYTSSLSACAAAAAF